MTTITKKDKWENTPVTALIKSNNAYFMLAQTFLSSIQRRLGEEYGVEPGSEMIAAMQEAEKHNLKVALVDRDITVTLKRAWRKMGVREKFRVIWEFLKAMLGYDEEELEELDLKELMKQDVISQMMEEFSKIAPSAAMVLISERDQYIAQKIFEESKKGKVVAVVGAGHINGIKKHLEKQELNVNLQELDQIPKKRMNLVKVVEVAIPVIFFGLLVGSSILLELTHGIKSKISSCVVPCSRYSVWSWCRNRTRTSFINSYCVCGCPVYVIRTVFRTRMVRWSCRSKITKTCCKRFPGV